MEKPHGGGRALTLRGQPADPIGWWRPESFDATAARDASVLRRDRAIVSAVVTLSGLWMSVWIWLIHGPPEPGLLAFKIAAGLGAGYLAARLTLRPPDYLPSILAISVIVLGAMVPLVSPGRGILRRDDPRYRLVSPLVALVFSPIPLHLWYGRRRRERPSAEKCLVEAAFRGDLDVVRAWVYRGVDVDRGGRYEGRYEAWKSNYTPLMAAVWRNYPAIVSILLERGADPNLGISDVGSPLCVARARAHGSAEIVRLLEARRARDFVERGLVHPV